jgi:hypothetical protein
VGVDFDGTLAESVPNFPAYGKPLMPMVELVRDLLKKGEDVRILTARADHPNHYGPVFEFCREHFGFALPVTDKKDFQMRVLYDDRARQVDPHTGELVA